MTDTLTLANFAATGFVLLVAHNLADHVTGQTDWQATNKGKPGILGWRANLAHVALYHVTLTVLGFAAWLVLPLHWSPLGVTLALAWSAVTHAFLDRRWPVRWMLVHTGSPEFARLNSGGMNGMYAADQALHGFALGVAAVMLAVVP